MKVEAIILPSYHSLSFVQNRKQLKNIFLVRVMQFCFNFSFSQMFFDIILFF